LLQFLISLTTMEVKTKKILIADDEPDIVEIISYNLRIEGYEVYTASNGSEAIDKAKQHLPDLIILDIMMPIKTGIEVCSIIRSQSLFQNTLIIFLTALSDETTHIKGLEIGADDYISKPVSPKILLSRVNALFRRLNKDDAKTIRINNIIIDPIKFLVVVNNEEIILAKKEFELLYLLASDTGKVFLRNEILSKVWGSDVIVGNRTIDVHIRKIRLKLNMDCIVTVKGVGYKFVL